MRNFAQDQLDCINQQGENQEPELTLSAGTELLMKSANHFQRKTEMFKREHRHRTISMAVLEIGKVFSKVKENSFPDSGHLKGKTLCPKYNCRTITIHETLFVLVEKH